MRQGNNRLNVTAEEEKPEAIGLDLIRCPVCKAAIAEAALGRMVIRCRNCRRWISAKRA